MGDVSFSLDGQVAVITGASMNIGKATAQAFAEAGADLLLVARGEQRLLEVAEDVRASTGRRVETVVADVGDREGGYRVFEAANDLFPRVDCLVNNAAARDKAQPIFDVDEDTWDDVFRVNVYGAFRLCQLFGKQMVEGDGGNIVNVISGSGLLPTPSKTVYGTSKAALWFLTRQLAAEAAPKVRANAVCPGSVTETGEPRTSPNSTQRMNLQKVPMGRIGLPHEIAGAALYLASPTASFTTGAMIVVNGGRPW